MFPRMTTRLRTSPSSSGVGGSSTIHPPPTANNQLPPGCAGAANSDRSVTRAAPAVTLNGTRSVRRLMSQSSPNSALPMGIRFCGSDGSPSDPPCATIEPRSGLRRPVGRKLGQHGRRYQRIGAQLDGRPCAAPAKSSSTILRASSCKLAPAGADAGQRGAQRPRPLGVFRQHGSAAPPSFGRIRLRLMFLSCHSCRCGGRRW